MLLRNHPVIAPKCSQTPHHTPQHTPHHTTHPRPPPPHSHTHTHTLTLTLFFACYSSSRSLAFRRQLTECNSFFVLAVSPCGPAFLYLSKTSKAFTNCFASADLHLRRCFKNRWYRVFCVLSCAELFDWKGVMSPEPSTDRPEKRGASKASLFCRLLDCFMCSFGSSTLCVNALLWLGPR
jgi:hypothetical protein